MKSCYQDVSNITDVLEEDEYEMDSEDNCQVTQKLSQY